jgi:hypothetical protein
VLFALDGVGRLRGRVRVPVSMRDWEDVSAARCPTGDCLYLADIGDNGLARRQVQIYRVTDPATDDSQSQSPERFNVTYADGPHNAEAMFVLGTDLFIVTRDRVGGIYRSPVPSGGGQELMFQRAGALGLQAVTDAEASPDEQSVAVRTSHEVVLYRAADLLRGEYAPSRRIPLDGLREWQGEAVALDGSTIYLSSEGRNGDSPGSMVSLRCTMPQ